MKALVTGAAGFIGSHLAEELLARGWDVTGIDVLTPYYDPAAKRRNVAALLERPRFQLVEQDLRTADLRSMLDESTVVFHLAGQPGVTESWDEFDAYVAHNVMATQRLAAAAAGRVRGIVFASSSSVYGDARTLPLLEEHAPAPISPYGATKSAAEQIMRAYAARSGTPTVVLRYFTVYGPRQRPDMAIARFVDAILNEQEVVVYGDGTQTRDVTYVGDVARATRRAGEILPAGAVINVAGGTRISVQEIIARIGGTLGAAPRIRYAPPRPGDVAHTEASLDRARALLDFAPEVPIDAGLRHQIAWQRAGGS